MYHRRTLESLGASLLVRRLRARALGVLCTSAFLGCCCIVVPVTLHTPMHSRVPMFLSCK